MQLERNDAAATVRDTLTDAIDEDSSIKLLTVTETARSCGLTCRGCTSSSGPSSFPQFAWAGRCGSISADCGTGSNLAGRAWTVSGRGHVKSRASGLGLAEMLEVQLVFSAARIGPWHRSRRSIARF